MLLMSMASCRQVHTISHFVRMPVGCKQQVGPGRNSTPVCTLRAALAATHVGMQPDCSKLGLGVRDISIAAGTGGASATLLS